MFKHKHTMTIKTITITEEAYGCIKSLKNDNESFSELFKRLGKRQMKVKDIVGALGHSEEEARAFQERVKSIREQMGRDMEERIQDVHNRFKRTH